MVAMTLRFVGFEQISLDIRRCFVYDIMLQIIDTNRVHVELVESFDFIRREVGMIRLTNDMRCIRQKLCLFIQRHTENK